MKRKVRGLRVFSILIFMVAVGMIIFSMLTLQGCNRATARAVGDWAGGIQQEYQQTSAQAQTSNFEWFYEQLAQIEAQMDNVNLLSNNPKFETEYIGGQQVLNSLIREYNGRAGMWNTRARYKDRDLPKNIKVEDSQLRFSY